MSDQYTRITCGGSPLDKTAPVVGLLFGNVVDGVLQLKDADDIPTDLSETSILQVDLHRAVFPQHVVVGWYRVSKEEEPTPNDLKVTQQLQQYYHNEPVKVETETAGQPTTTTTTTMPPQPPIPLIFCLLQVQATAKPEQEAEEETADNHNLTQELPINLYELHDTTTTTTTSNIADSTTTAAASTTSTTTTILLALQHWDLETSDPERIAVERVMREQPLEANHASTFCAQSQSVQHSLTSMKDRIAFLVSFLQDTALGNIDPHHGLLRDVQGLVTTLGPLAVATRECDESQDVVLLSHLAAVAKTTSAVQSYTDKFRLMQENRALGKEMRRAF